MLRRSLVAAAALWMVLAPGVASAAGTWLDCRATGAAGAISFKFAFDEQNRSAAVVWPRATGRSADSANRADITLVAVSAVLVNITDGVTYAYQVAINRADGGLVFTHFPQTGGRETSNGTCARGAAPGVLF